MEYRDNGYFNSENNSDYIVDRRSKNSNSTPKVQNNHNENPKYRHNYKTYDVKGTVPDNVRNKPSPKKIKRKNKKQRKPMDERTKARLCLFLIKLFAVVFFALLFGIISFAVFMNNLKSVTLTEAEYRTVSIGNSEASFFAENKTVGKYYRNGVIYVSMDDITRLCGLTACGDEETIRYSNENGDFALFRYGSKTVNINGSYVSLENEIYGTGKDMFVPLDFLKLYTAGLSFTADEEKKTLNIDLENDEFGTVNGLSFKLTKGEITEGISFEYLPESVRALLRDTAVPDQNNDNNGQEG